MKRQQKMKPPRKVPRLNLPEKSVSQRYAQKLAGHNMAPQPFCRNFLLDGWKFEF